jgi:hypothetical protein
MNYVSCCCAVCRHTTRMPNKLQGAQLAILCTTLWSILLRWEVIFPNATQAINWAPSPLIGCPKLLVPYIRSSPLNLKAAVPYLRRLDAGVPARRPGFNPMSGHVGFVVDKVVLRQVFSEYFGIPCQFSFHLLLHIHPSSSASTICQFVADVPSGQSLTPPQEI